MSSLPAVVHPRCQECHPPALLLEACLPQTKQARQPAPVAAKAREPRLLPWPGACPAGAALERGPPRLLAQDQRKSGCVTRFLNRTTHCKCCQYSPSRKRCVTRSLDPTTRCYGWAYRSTDRLCVTRRHRQGRPPHATIGTRYPLSPGMKEAAYGKTSA